VNAVLDMEEGGRVEVTLENLSSGGVGFSRVPADWQTGKSVRCALGRPGEPGILNVVGTVAWKEGDTVGIAFDPESTVNSILVQRALRRFLEEGR
jgi:hypothetical protein